MSKQTNKKVAESDLDKNLKSLSKTLTNKWRDYDNVICISSH